MARKRGNPPMKPEIKKLLSALCVAVVGSILVVLNAYVVKLPEVYQGFAGAVLAAAVHYVNAWGHADQVNAQVATKVTEVIGKETT